MSYEHRILCEQLRHKLNFVERERDELRTEIERHDAAAGETVENPVLGYADNYRGMASRGVESIPIWSVITDLERNIAPLYTAAQPAVLPPEVIAQAQHISSVLEMIGSFDADDIDSDAVDLRFEVDGIETGSDASITEYATKGAEIIRSLALGAQQQKVVELPDMLSEEFHDYGGNFEYATYQKTLHAELDAANVKYEVKK